MPRNPRPVQDDHELHPGTVPRSPADPREDPAPGLEYGSLEDERRSSTPRVVLGILLVLAMLIVAVVLIAS